MRSNGPGKNLLLSTLFFAAATLFLPVVSSAQTSEYDGKNNAGEL